jgi:hypothetical protein
MFCTECGKRIGESSKFCTFCGRVVQSGLPALSMSNQECEVRSGLDGPVLADGPDAPTHAQASGSAESAKALFFAHFYANALEYLRNGPKQNACHDLVLHLCTISRELLKDFPEGASNLGMGRADALLYEPLAYITLAALVVRDLRVFADPEFDDRRGELLEAWRDVLRLARRLNADDFTADPDAPPPF